jgi:hypothetical protein
LVAALRVEVARDHEKRLAVRLELACERLAEAAQAGLPGSTRPGLNDSLGADGRPTRRRRRRVAAGPIAELDTAIGAEEEADADVATRLTAILVVDRVDLPVLVRRPADGLDRRDQPVPGCRGVRYSSVCGAVVVLDLLDREDVRRAEVVHDQVRVAGKGVVPGSRFSTL